MKKVNNQTISEVGTITKETDHEMVIILKLNILINLVY